MKTRSNRFALVLAMMLASLAATGVYFFTSSGGGAETAPAPAAAPTATPLPTTAVLVARHDIAPNTAVTAEMVEVKEVPLADKNPRALTMPDEAIGRVAAVDLVAGEQIVGSRLVDRPVGDARAATFAYEVPVGKRALSVVFDEVIGAGAMVQPGDRVDVIGYFEIDVDAVTFDAATESRPAGQDDGDDDDSSDGDDKEDEEADYTQYVSAYVLQDVEVLWVAQATEPQDGGIVDQGQPAEPTPTPESTTEDAVTATADQAGDPVARPTAVSVTLAVTPEQAQRLLLATQTVKKEQGSLRLSLRAPGDTTTVDLPPAQLGVLPVGGLLGDLNRPMIPSDLVITDVEFNRTVLGVGEVLEFKATVKNVSDTTIVSGRDAPPEFTYTQGVAYDELGFFPDPGTYRLGLNVEGTGPTQFPYRWSLGRDLKPGETVEVVGSVKLSEPVAATHYWLGVILEPNTVAQDGVGVEQITVLQPSQVAVRHAAAQVLAEPASGASVVVEVEQGEKLTVLETRGDWYRVETKKGNQGWISMAAVDVVPPEVQADNAPASGTEATPVGATPVSATPTGT